ncbi:MAG TPA: hypothetical protein VFH58_13450 [Acidimicrobiales bacterium]|nr:hypothetical protein [Acidimicrobiales bacterium]
MKKPIDHPPPGRLGGGDETIRPRRHQPRQHHTDVRSRRAWRRCALSIVTVLVLLAGLVADAGSAAAANNGTWAVSPTGTNGNSPRDWFEYELRAGQTIRDLVSISNLTAAPKTFLIYPADGYNTSVGGAFALTQQGARLKDAGAWLELGYKQLTVPPRTRADVPFQVAVPVDASPGDHAAGIVVEDTAALRTPVNRGKGVFVKERVATRVYIRIQGPLQPALEVSQLAVRHQDPLLPPVTGSGKAEIAYVVTNSGNVRLSGTATLKIKDVFGRTLKTYPARNIVQLLPKQTAAFGERWNGLPVIDRMTAEVDVQASGASTRGTRAFWKIPWLEVLLVVVLVLLLVRWRRRRRRGPAPVPAPPPPPTRRQAVPV